MVCRTKTLIFCINLQNVPVNDSVLSPKLHRALLLDHNSPRHRLFFDGHVIDPGTEIDSILALRMQQQQQEAVHLLLLK